MTLASPSGAQFYFQEFHQRFEFLRYVVSGRSLAWKSVLDIRRSVDLLVSRPEVDASRIGDHPHPNLSLSAFAYATGGG